MKIAKFILAIGFVSAFKISKIPNVNLLKILIVQFTSLNNVRCSPPCEKGYGPNSCSYVPAKPGHTPSCANAGSTYCEKCPIIFDSL